MFFVIYGESVHGLSVINSNGGNFSILFLYKGPILAVMYLNKKGLWQPPNSKVWYLSTFVLY
jgi:hypothetical protein